MYHSFLKSYRVGSSTGVLAIKIFSAWDFKVVQRHSVKLQSENICTQLKVRSGVAVLHVCQSCAAPLCSGPPGPT